MFKRSQVKVVADSCCDLPPGLAQELGITVVPAYVHFSGKSYRDGVELGPDEFYSRLVSSPTLPTTSAPPPEDFLQVYRQLAKEAEEIISIHISGKLSRLYESALAASKEAGVRVEVLDSLSVSMGAGLLAILATERATAGERLEGLVSHLRQLTPKLHLFALLDTLEYLKKGGRIGKVQAFLGGLLHIKPLICVKDGEVHPLERVRSRAKAIDRLLETVSHFPAIYSLAVIYNTTPDEALELTRRLGSLYPEEKIYQAQLGPALGTHGGPGVLGVALMEA